MWPNSLLIAFRPDAGTRTSFIQLARESGSHTIAPLFRREDMGLMMDVKFETISRALASMSEQGLISDVTRLSVQIPNMNALKDFAKRGL